MWIRLHGNSSFDLVIIRIQESVDKIVPEIFYMPTFPRVFTLVKVNVIFDIDQKFAYGFGCCLYFAHCWCPRSLGRLGEPPTISVTTVGVYATLCASVVNQSSSVLKSPSG